MEQGNFRLIHLMMHWVSLLGSEKVSAVKFIGQFSTVLWTGMVTVISQCYTTKWHCSLIIHMNTFILSVYWSSLSFSTYPI